MVLTGRTGLLALICVLPIAFAPWPARAFELLALVLAVVLAIDIALAASPRRLRYTRSPDTSVRLGQQAEATLLVHNEGRRRFRGQVRDAWPPSARAEPRINPLRLAAGQDHQIRTQLRPVRRGDQRAAVVTARSLGPLGLAGRQSSQAVPGQLRVLPPFLSRKHLPSRLAKLREIDGLLPTLIRGQGTEFDSLREYVVGDDVRSIDWRATARAGATMLRTWRPERDRHVVILIDTGRTSAARVGDGVRLDAAFEASLLLAALAQHAGDHVHLLAFDRLVRARVSRVDGPTLLPAMVDALAPVEPSLLDTDWDAAFAAIRALGVRPSLIVLLTAQDEPEASRGFLSALPSLAAHTTVLVGTATDVATEAEAAAPPVDADDVYRHAAAARTVSDARRVAGAIDRAGAEPVAADPNTLPTRIADRYLALKAHGRL